MTGRRELAIPGYILPTMNPLLPTREFKDMPLVLKVKQKIFEIRAFLREFEGTEKRRRDLSLVPGLPTLVH